MTESSKGNTCLFLAAPFTEMVDETGLVNAEFRSYLTRVLAFLESSGYEVINAHVREQWGARLDAPDQAIALDFLGIDKSDALVVLMGMAPSEGVLLEIGYAVGKGKPIVVVQGGEALQATRYLTLGLESVAKADCRAIVHLEETEAAITAGLDHVL